MVPLSPAALTSWLVAPFVGLLLFWAALAVRQAYRTDPARARREARARLARTLRQIESADDAGRPALLLAWQRDTAVLWQIAHAAPSASAFLRVAASSSVGPDSQAVSGAGPRSGNLDTLSPADAAWPTLWMEADRALYGAGVPLPADWVARALAALAARPVPAFRPLRAFLPQNLMPFAAALAFLLVMVPLVLRAAEADPAAAYRQGDFASAEKSWRTAVAGQPTDWIARHNLSLALAQQDQAGEAAAQASAAFAQQPDNPSVQWHFALAVEKAGFVPAALAGFLTPTTRQTIARAASPAEWQGWLVAAAFAGAGALGVILFNAYGSRRRITYWSATAGLLASITLAATAGAGVRTYGMAADANAVIIVRAGTLRSIPTEADTAQKTLPVVAGTMGIADRSFLGWSHLAFENGQTGWVRKEEFVPLWK